MSNSKFRIGNLSGKGLAAVAGACVIAVGAAGFYSYSKISDKLNAELIGNSSSGTLSADAGEENNSPVNAEKKNVAKSTETTAAVTEKPPAETTGKTSAGALSETDKKETEQAMETALPQIMVRPLNGEILNEFSDGELVKSKTLNVWKTHDGVDIAGAQDEQVKSMTSGTVTKIFDDQMLGACVIVDHGGGLEAYYCNLSKDIPVAEGQSVSAGTILGSVGSTAESEVIEESHLHFAVRKNGEWIDPIALISGEGS